MKKSRMIRAYSVVVSVLLLACIYMSITNKSDLEAKLEGQKIDLDRQVSLLSEEQAAAASLRSWSQALKEDYDALEETLKKYEGQVSSYQVQADKDQSTIDDLNSSLDQLEGEVDGLKKDKPYYKSSPKDLYAIYDSNVSSEYVIPHFYLSMDKSQTIEARVKTLIDTLQRYKFKDMPIELVDIINDNGRLIALVDLRDSETTDSKWVVDYMTGSSGGYLTGASLVETLLQRQAHLDEWIDGVYFSYYGQHEYIDSHDPGLFIEPYYRETGGGHVRDDKINDSVEKLMFFGEWYLEETVLKSENFDSVSPEAYDNFDYEAYLGSVLEYQHDYIRVLGNYYEGPKYELHITNTSDYSSGGVFKSPSLAGLIISDEIYVLESEKYQWLGEVPIQQYIVTLKEGVFNPLVSGVLVLNEETILVGLGGVIIKANRIK